MPFPPAIAQTGKFVDVPNHFVSIHIVIMMMPAHLIELFFRPSRVAFTQDFAFCMLNGSKRKMMKYKLVWTIAGIRKLRFMAAARSQGYAFMPLQPCFLLDEMSWFRAKFKMGKSA